MPVVDAMQRLRGRRLGAVAGAAGSIADAVNRGESVADAIAECDSPATEQAAAAVRATEQSGNPDVLTRLASLLRWRSEYFRVSRLSWLYPFILLIVAYTTAVLVMAPMLRQHQGRDFTWSESVLSFSHWLESNWQVPPIVLLLAVLAWLLLRNSLLPLPKDIRIRLFCHSLVDQITAEVPESDAIQNSAALAGEQSLSARPDLTFKSPEMVALLTGVQSPLLDLPGASEEQTLVARLKYLAAIHDERARRHEYFWSRMLPRIAMVVVGGGVTLAYVWWVIAPVYQQVAQW